MYYIKIIEQAIIFFPVIAILITIPFILIQYHKYGSISLIKSIVIYSFILYLLCAYFLVILPLPSFESVAKLTTPRAQLVPFMFIYEFIKSISSGLKMFQANTFYMPLFNILLTIPFGIYMRYLFKLNLNKVVLYSFILSLFFELTQLSGLYFIYARGYRLFDVDDLFLNTIGGTFGYLIGEFILKPLPTIDSVNNTALQNGIKVSGMKRAVSFSLDIFIYFACCVIVGIIFNNRYVAEAMLIVYYIVIPTINKGSTLGQKFLNLKVITYNNKHFILKLIMRIFIFILIYIIFPIGILRLMIFIGNTELSILTKEIIDLILAFIILLTYLITFIKYFFTSREMLYEKFSRTKLVSTLMKQK